MAVTDHERSAFFPPPNDLEDAKPVVRVEWSEGGWMLIEVPHRSLFCEVNTSCPGMVRKTMRKGDTGIQMGVCQEQHQVPVDLTKITQQFGYLHLNNKQSRK